MNAIDAPAEALAVIDDRALHEASLSSALATVFRGNFCHAILPGRIPQTFRRDEVLYELGAKDRVFFFIQSGFVRTGTLTQDGREIVYDVRKAGGVAGELCICRSVRGDRAVALEPSEAIAVPHSEIIDAIRKSPELVGKLMEIFCDCLSDAYQQINTLAFHDTARRLTYTLLGLASKIGRPAGRQVEIPAYLTQEDIAQMVAARRERVSTALNLLRQRGLVHYSNRGHILLDIEALENQSR
jgi:CRP/FNR family transcriptional regulator, cyclic AMP receptor protein